MKNVTPRTCTDADLVRWLAYYRAAVRAKVRGLRCAVRAFEAELKRRRAKA